ncbi:MAG: O-methyltransferase [Chlorobiaceae bacterium]
MSKASSLPYQLRPNKAVDRELFLMLLGRIAGVIGIETYRYIGLGGPFLEDFRMLHARLGITDMVCLEIDENVNLRQNFNRPISSIQCLFSSIEDYLKKTEFYEPVILWLDYTAPSSLREQIECFCHQVCTLPVGSIVKITLNANPSSLGTPEPHEVKRDIFNTEYAVQGWRLDRLKEKLGEFVPSSMTPRRLITYEFGKALLEILELALDREIDGYPDRNTIWCLTTLYADGQNMVTATVYVTPPNESDVEQILKSWSFYSTPAKPHVLDMPTLSTRERLTLEQSDNPDTCLRYELPKSSLKRNPLETFKLFYRVYPYFARVDM